MPLPKDPIKADEWRRKQRETHLGRKRTPEQIQKAVNARKKKDIERGYHHSQEALQKIREKRLGKPTKMRGRPKTDEWKRKIGLGNKGKKRSEECIKGMRERNLGNIPWNKGKTGVYTEETLKIMSQNAKEFFTGRFCGINHYNWKGGRSFDPYCPKFNNKRKKAVREFFGYMCICSGELESDLPRKLNCHHTYHDKNEGCNGRPFNLVPMNNYHHTRELHYEKEYAAYIEKTLREGFKWGIWNEQEYIEKVMYDE